MTLGRWLIHIKHRLFLLMSRFLSLNGHQKTKMNIFSFLCVIKKITRPSIRFFELKKLLHDAVKLFLRHKNFYMMLQNFF